MMNSFTQILILLLLVNESRAKKNELEFIHVAKNAGTSIENAAAKEGIAWGACHYHQFRHCLDVKPDLLWVGGRQWHALPQNFEKNPFEDKETFAVVRNPYDRVISYYYYYNRDKDMRYLNNKNSLNEFVLQKLKKFPSLLLSSSDYIFDKNGEQIIDYVLHFETLNSDGKFDALMKKFNLNIKLPQHSLNQRKNGDGLTLNDLSKKAIGYINGYYKNDFISFGYSFMKTNELEFIHIVKNAGTSIENAAAKEGIAWGACHYHQFGHCLDVKPDLVWSGGSQWHALPRNFETNPFEGKETFTVVRNPYDRVISYYYYHNRNQDMKHLNKREQLNEFIAQILKKIKTGLLPSSHYIFDENGTKIIDHVLHFETLDSDGKFDALMKKFQLNIKLPEKSLNQRKSGDKLTIKDLSKESIDFINKYYESDFISFGYNFI